MQTSLAWGVCNVASRGSSGTTRRASKRGASDPVEMRVDVFGDEKQASQPIFPGDISHEAVVALIGRILAVGGYISFAAGSGGESVKVSFAASGFEGSRWAYSEAQLAGMVAKIWSAVRPDATEGKAATGK